MKIVFCRQFRLRQTHLDKRTDGQRLAFLELLSEPKKAFSPPFSSRSPQLAIPVMIILTPMTPLEARDVSGVVSSFISGTGLALANEVSVAEVFLTWRQ